MPLLWRNKPLLLEAFLHLQPTLPASLQPSQACTGDMSLFLSLSVRVKPAAQLPWEHVLGCVKAPSPGYGHSKHTRPGIRKQAAVPQGGDSSTRPAATCDFSASIATRDVSPEAWALAPWHLVCFASARLKELGASPCSPCQQRGGTRLLSEVTPGARGKAGSLRVLTPTAQLLGWQGTEARRLFPIRGSTPPAPVSARTGRQTWPRRSRRGLKRERGEAGAALI